MRDGVISVAVDSTPWATQLRFLEATLIERANAVIGRDAVHAIARARTPGIGREISRGNHANSGGSVWYTGATREKASDLRFCGNFPGVRSESPRSGADFPDRFLQS